MYKLGQILTQMGHINMGTAAPTFYEEPKTRQHDLEDYKRLAHKILKEEPEAYLAKVILELVNKIEGLELDNKLQKEKFNILNDSDFKTLIEQMAEIKERLRVLEYPADKPKHSSDVLMGDFLTKMKSDPLSWKP